MTVELSTTSASSQDHSEMLPTKPFTIHFILIIRLPAKGYSKVRRIPGSFDLNHSFELLLHAQIWQALSRQSSSEIL